jgi:hypothetical protein
MSTLFGKIAFASAIAAALAALGSSGCTTNAYCFANCDSGGTGGSTTSSTTSATGTGGEGGCIFGCETTSSTSSTSSGTGGCQPTNGGIEICDGLDNDCNGQIDDIPGLDLTKPETCGTCSNNCYTIPNSNWKTDSIKCTASPTPGMPGTCSGMCADNYYDHQNNDGLCETYCVKTASDDKTCNGLDDNCNGQVDEDVDLCTSVTDCGYCGHNCSLPHATAQCVHTGSAACDASNTECKIQSCTCNGPGDCWWDLDNSAATGCEYPCFPTGPEICGDGIDNDCDGLIDEADDLSQDPQIGQPCQGGTQGVCADPANAGTTSCVSHQVVCTGPKVVKPGDLQETCNGKDDDCDGTIDNNPTDVGGSCGGGMFAPCQPGTYQCQGGMLVCVGAINPGTETCNGIDDDCDGVIDNNLPTAQSGAPCDVPPPPPAGATSPCKAGVTACVGGTVQCQGSVKATSTQDTCGVDANCDGQLTNQPPAGDVHNCGGCGIDCLAGAVHATWACEMTGGAYACVFKGCQTGYWDNGGPGDAMAGDNKCGYACTFISSKESCNGLDDNCDGQIDEPAALTVPTPTQVCGVNAAATTPECSPTSGTNPGGVTVACTNGAWKCTFNTAGVCSPSCATAAEVCDSYDNNCNGLVNENVPNFGQPCASDDGKPAPGDGACRTTGTFVCNPNDPAKNSTVCSATKDLTKAGPELCDGIDNDCDGLVDEPFSNKGSNAMYFVKPAVTKVAASLWIYSYEASRPKANTVTPGSGNGYYCTGASCPTGIPTAPAGVTLDKTPACSVPTKIPWFNVTPIEAEQTCNAMGGRVCTTAEWKTACVTNPPSATTCSWGYAPDTAAGCGTAIGGTSTGTAYPFPIPSTTTRWCNLGPTFDFNTSTSGDQDGLLVTASSALKNCYADWTLLLSNGTANGKIFDLTGNLREITKLATNQYTLMGGSFATQDESGAACGFDFYVSDQNFALYDLGFRCCFSSDPTL